MLFTVGEGSADTDDEHSAISLADGILALLGSFVRIHLQQFLCMNKVDLLRKERLQLGIGLTSEVLRTADGGVDALHHVLQEIERTVLTTDDSLPVPLVDI